MNAIVNFTRLNSSAYWFLNPFAPLNHISLLDYITANCFLNIVAFIFMLLIWYSQNFVLCVWTTTIFYCSKEVFLWVVKIFRSENKVNTITDLPTAPEYPEHLLKSMFAPQTLRVRKFTPLKPYFSSNSRRSANFSAISFYPFAFERKRII